jgi:hypothetical protein
MAARMSCAPRAARCGGAAARARGAAAATSPCAPPPPLLTAHPRRAALCAPRARRARGSSALQPVTRATATAPSAPATGGSGAGSKPTAVVVGAGVGGLAMAGRLARAGYAVTLLEKNAGVGGRMQSYNPPVRAALRGCVRPQKVLLWLAAKRVRRAATHAAPLHGAIARGTPRTHHALAAAAPSERRPAPPAWHCQR